MPMVVDGTTFYKTTEAARMAGISKATLLRWLNDRSTAANPCRDRRGWRLFSEQDIAEVQAEANKIVRY